MPGKRRAYAWLLALAALAGLGASASAQAKPDQPDEAERAFRVAFGPEVSPTQCTALLEQLAKEHADSKWADDALWVLGEAARQQGLPQRVIYYWQFLMARRPDVDLEEFTRGLDIYRASGLPQVEQYLQATGLGYVIEEGTAKREGVVFINARRFNAVPMTVWEGLARSYEAFGKPALALKAYRRALSLAPAAGPWGKTYQERANRLETALKGRAGGQQPAAEAAAAKPQASAVSPAGPSPAPEARREDAAAPEAGLSARRVQSSVPGAVLIRRAAP